MAAAAAVLGIAALFCTILSIAEQSEAATTAVVVSFASGGVTLNAVMYKPNNYATGSNYRAVVMMHGCSGMWSNRVVGATNGDGTPNLQNYVEKWGWKVAEQGMVALAVDSFTARKPAAADSSAWQNQCSGATYAGQVDPYTTRVTDARSARAYLVGLAGSKIDPLRVGLLGWSHGAQAVMVESAETSRTSNVAKDTSYHVFKISVAYYPGCGDLLGFGTVSTSYWRPFRGVQMHLGTADDFHDDCLARRTKAVASPYFKSVPFFSYTDAPHSFDTFSQTWPTSKCATPSSGEECAMRSADIDALAYFIANL